MSPSIYLAVSHSYAKVGLTALLENAGYEPISGTLDGIDRTDPPVTDLTIVDLSIDEEKGLLVTSRLREADPDHPVLVLLLPESRPAGERAIEEGANGYLLLNQGGSELAEACGTVLDGRIYRPPLSAD